MPTQSGVIREKMVHFDRKWQISTGNAEYNAPILSEIRKTPPQLHVWPVFVVLDVLFFESQAKSNIIRPEVVHFDWKFKHHAK